MIFSLIFCIFFLLQAWCRDMKALFSYSIQIRSAQNELHRASYITVFKERYPEHRITESLFRSAPRKSDANRTSCDLLHQNHLMTVPEKENAGVNIVPPASKKIDKPSNNLMIRLFLCNVALLHGPFFDFLFGSFSFTLHNEVSLHT